MVVEIDILVRLDIAFLVDEVCPHCLGCISLFEDVCLACGTDWTPLLDEWEELAELMK